MNKNRRKEIDTIIEKLGSLIEEIEIVLEDEECYRDEGIPESMQYNSPQYDAAEEAITHMDDARGYLGNAIEELNGAKGEK
ncbi:MAG: hypothetical protein RR505_05035 [Raoultibacter sp.]